MAAKKEEKEKVTVINFRDKSSNWWVNNKHYTLTEVNQILFVAGGLEIEAETEFLRQFIKRNKKSFIPREKVAVIEYFEKFTFGKYINQKVDYVKDLDRKYLVWCRDNYQFKIGEEKLKSEIISILK